MSWKAVHYKINIEKQLPAQLFQKKQTANKQNGKEKRFIEQHTKQTLYKLLCAEEVNSVLIMKMIPVNEIR